MTDTAKIQRSYVKADPELRFRTDYLSGSDAQISEREWPDAEARFAMQLLSTNGVLMGDDGGEDSTGRAKMKPMEAQALVTRAFDIAQAAYAEARKRGCMLALPDQATIKEKANEAKDAERAAEDARDAARVERRKAKADA